MKFDWKTLIAPSVHLAEAALGDGHGNQKLAMVANILQGALFVAAATGAIPLSVATDMGQIKSVINTTVDQEKASGALDKTLQDSKK